MTFTVVALIAAVTLLAVAVSLFRAGGSKLLPVVLLVVAALLVVYALSVDTGSSEFGPVDPGAGATRG